MLNDFSDTLLPLWSEEEEESLCGPILMAFCFTSLIVTMLVSCSDRKRARAKDLQRKGPLHTACSVLTLRWLNF